MKEPFVKKGSYSSSVNLNKETFKYLIERLKQLGFNSIEIKTPKIIIEPSGGIGNNKINTEPKNIYTENEFFIVEKEFIGVLLSASNRAKEEIKILFINNTNLNMVFDDDIFSLFKKDQSQKIYISTNDLVRTYAYIAFIKDFMDEHSQGKYLSYFLLLLLMLTTTGIFTVIYLKVPHNAYYIAGLAILIIPSIYFLPQKGLHLVPKKRNLPESIKELKKTWIVILFTILGTLLATHLYNIWFQTTPVR